MSVAVYVYIVMLLYLVEPESSRTLCCKVYIKQIGVVFRWFFSQECLENNLVSQ